MSNDLKFWVFRGINVALFVVEGVILAQAINAVFSDHDSTGRATVWIIVFFVVCLINIPVYVLTRRAKEDRWKNDPLTAQEQSAVEILAAYSAQQRAEKEKTQKAAKPRL